MARHSGKPGRRGKLHLYKLKFTTLQNFLCGNDRSVVQVKLARIAHKRNRHIGSYSIHENPWRASSAADASGPALPAA